MPFVLRSRPLGPLLAVAAAFAAAGGCGKRSAPGEPRTGSNAPPDRAVVSLAVVEARTGPSGKAPVAVRLTRGSGLQIRRAEGDFWLVVPPKGGEAWLPAGSFERLVDEEAREKRAAAIASFPPQPARAVEPCPVLLAPDYGAARRGELEDGDDVSVLVADHDFYGVRLDDGSLAFVPARSVRLLPSLSAAMPDAGRRDAILPSITPLAGPEEGPAVPDVSAVRPPGGGRAGTPEEPLAALPAGAEPPALVTRIDPRYPDLARRAGVSGEVVLRIVVDTAGAVTRVEVVSGGPFGLTDAAVDAVRRWSYRPARIGARPVAVYKTVRVRFSLAGKADPTPPL